MANFKLAELSLKGQGLLDEARTVFGNSRVDSLRERVKNIPAVMTEPDKKLNVVFVGPYAAGKSTIVSLLTGKQLKTGGGITTEETTTTEWNGILVTDTPGIHTGVRADHDAMSYDAISKVDLLVFVVSQKGFTQSLGEHFRKLAIDMKKGAEMMLVVNKMDTTALGNTPHVQDITFEKNIAQAVSPYTREGLYTTFIAARSWELALEETDPKRKQAYIERSGWSQLVDNLNRFVHDHGSSGKYTTNLSTLDRQLTEALNEYPTNSPTMNAMKETYRRQHNLLVAAKKNVQDNSKSIIRKGTSQVIDWGNRVADSITSDSKQEELNNEIKGYEPKIKGVWDNAIKELNETIEEQNRGLTGDFENLANSTFGKQVLSMVSNNIHVSGAVGSFSHKWGDALSKFGNGMAKMAKGSGAVGDWQHFFYVSEASGSKLHDVILKGGHLVHYKFGSWEATRMAAKFGQLGKALGVLGAGLGVVGQISSDQQESEKEQTVSQAKSAVRSNFTDVADAIEMKFDENTNMWVEEKYEPAIKEVDSSLKELENLESQGKQEYQTLVDLQIRTRILIGEIQDL